MVGSVSTSWWVRYEQRVNREYGFLSLPSIAPVRCTRGCLAASLIEASTATACFPLQDGQRDGYNKTHSRKRVALHMIRLLVDVDLSNFARLTRVERRS